MLPLPFVTEPTKKFPKVIVGTEESGQLAIEKYEDLTPVERRFIKAQNLFVYNKALAKLARAVSLQHGSKFAYTNDRINAYVFGGVIEGDTVKIIADDKALKAFKDKECKVVAVKRNDKYDIVSVTVELDEKRTEVTLEQLELIHPEWYEHHYQEIQDLADELIASLEVKNRVYATAILIHRVEPTWTIEKSEDPKLKALIEEIAEFAYKEENGWKEAEKAEPKPSTDEELVKS